MPDWGASMAQSFEYYIVDPITWRDKSLLTNVESCEITRDSSNLTLGTSTITCPTDLTDTYVRAYLITKQDGISERFALGTYMYQTPNMSNNGYYMTLQQDGYTPLIELKETMPRLGYSVPKGSNIMEQASSLAAAHMRAPLVPATADPKLIENFIAQEDDTWLTFLTDLIFNADYAFDLDAYGQVMFTPNVDVDDMTPTWVYSDDSTSILYPDISISRDLYGVPNVLEAIYSTPDGRTLTGRAVNDDEDSVVSTVTRGREIMIREQAPSSEIITNQDQIDNYAYNRLRELSSIEYRITYTHGYCPVRVGDCVELNHYSSGIDGVKAKVINQVINCAKGCNVKEIAIFNVPLWG